MACSTEGPSQRPDPSRNPKCAAAAQGSVWLSPQPPTHSHLPPSSSSRRSRSQPSHGKSGASAAAESLYHAAPTTLRAAAIRACRMRSVSSNPPPRSRSCVRGSSARQRDAARGKSRRAVGREGMLPTGTPICTVMAHRAEKRPATTPCAIHEVCVAPQPVASRCLAVVPHFGGGSLSSPPARTRLARLQWDAAARNRDAARGTGRLAGNRTRESLLAAHKVAPCLMEMRRERLRARPSACSDALLGWIAVVILFVSVSRACGPLSPTCERGRGSPPAPQDPTLPAAARFINAYSDQVLCTHCHATGTAACDRWSDGTLARCTRE